MIKLIEQINVLIKFLKAVNEKQPIIFYSEGNASWPHISNLLSELLKNKVEIIFLTSSNDDPGLKIKDKRCESFYIERGYVLNWLFNNHTGKLMILRTPDLNKFQLKRSRNKCHYIYTHHSLVSHHMAYRKGAFDNYDTILCAGPHHYREIRAIENKYNLTKKYLIKFGYALFDNIKIIKYKDILTSRKNIHVVIAPSWGVNSIFEKIGIELVSLLIKEKFKITLRPHPETIRQNSKNYNNLKSQFSDNKLISFDEIPSSFKTFSTSTLLITDYSGTSFEYAFGYLKPVLFIDLPKKINNNDFESIKHIPIEISSRSKIGKIIKTTNLSSVSHEIKNLLNIKYTLQLKKERKKYLYNYGKASKNGVGEIIKLFRDL